MKAITRQCLSLRLLVLPKEKMALKRILDERRSHVQLINFVWIATNNRLLLTFSLFAGFAV